MAAIKNCTDVLTDPLGPYKLTPAEALEAWAELSLYTNAESCPMVRRRTETPSLVEDLDEEKLTMDLQCASAIRWTGFREYIYGTSIDTLIRAGWGQIRVASIDIFRQSADLPSQTRLMGEVLTNETDPYFLWQYDPEYPCPAGCSRGGESCVHDE